MSEYDSAVVDIETGGTDPARSLVLQIAAVKFNSKTREVSHDFFDRACMPQPNRSWSEDTREWWMKRKDVLQGIMTRMEETKKVLEDLYAWAEHGKLVLWAKPTHFDHSFLASLYRDYGMQVPFHYRTANDQNSFARGVYWPEEPPQWERILSFEGDAHNAIHDCLHQLKTIYCLLEKRPPPTL